MANIGSYVRLGTLTASLRKNSFSHALSRSLSGLAPDGVLMEELPTIGAIPLFNQDILDDDGVPAAVSALAEATQAVDGVIIVTPEYNWSIPGVLKNALDWISRLQPNPLEGKPVTVFTSSPGLLGGARAHAPIRHVLHALGCSIMARPEVQIAQIKSKVSVDPARIIDVATAEFVAARIAAFKAFAASTPPA